MTDKKDNTNEVRYLILNGFQECRKEIKRDIEDAVQNAFSKVGIDINNQEEVNKIHKHLSCLQDFIESRRDTRSTLKKASLGFLVPTAISACMVALFEYMKRGL